jgi:hypothetical protein
MKAWFKKKPNFDFQHLILKYFSKKHTLIFIIGTFCISRVSKSSFCKNRPKFCRLANIPFQNISKNPKERFTFRQKSDGFCNLLTKNSTTGIAIVDLLQVSDTSSLPKSGLGSFFRGLGGLLRGLLNWQG